MAFFSTSVRSIAILLNFCQTRVHLSMKRFSSNSNGKFIIPPHMLFLKIASLVGEGHACELMSSIERKVCDGDAPILEMRAGSGHLTKRLLASGVKHLHVFEKRKMFRPELKEILSGYAERSSLHARTFNDIFFEDNNLPVFTSPYLKESLPFSCEKSWDDSPAFKVIAGHSSGKVMLVALAHICKNMMYLGMGRPEFILTLPLQQWNKLLRRGKKGHYNEYSTTGLLFPDFYEFEVLGRIKPPVLYNEGETTNRVSKEEFVTVSVAPHRDLQKAANAELIEEYLFFATQTMNGKAKHSYVISALDKWVPDSGKDIVARGINCFTTFTDLTPTEALEMFSFWRSLPPYKTSLFMYEFKDYLNYSKY